MISRKAGWIAASVAAALLLAALSWGLVTAARNAPSLEGSPAPALAVRTLQDGRTVHLTDSRGRRPVVLNFWASWCVPCREEAPVLNAAARRFAGRVDFLGANIQDSDAAARRYQAEVQSPYPVGPIIEGSYRDFGVNAPPGTFLIDRRGSVSAKIIGPVGSTRLQVAIEQLRP
jgi:cytochrome c biogenesis protein CcmG, thiol:disulfide interchange protein DsbE